MDRNMSRTLRTLALLLAVTVTPAVVPTAAAEVQDLETSPGQRVVIDPNGLTNSCSGRMLIDPDGRV